MTRRTSLRLVPCAVVSALALALAACGPSQREPDDSTVTAGGDGPATTSSAAPSTPAESTPTDTPPQVAEPVVAGTVATGLTSPWDIAFLPDGSALVSERDTGQIKLVTADGQVSVAGEIPDADPSSEGGLLGLAVSPDFEQNPAVYAYYSTSSDNRLVRMSYDNGQLGEPEVLLDGVPVAALHNGGRIAFGPDGMLYVTTGDATEEGQAQDPDSLAGKILRLTPDGQPAPGNPTEGSPAWSLGHRNVQGLSWDDDGRLYASEFGQDTFDELNLIEAGLNYGWPAAEGDANLGDFIDPLVVWTPDEASPSGITHASDAVWVASLQGARLWRVVLDDGVVAGPPTPFFEGEYGRLRAVAEAPDGSLWLATSNTDGRGEPSDGDDQILRIELR